MRASFGRNTDGVFSGPVVAMDTANSHHWEIASVDSVALCEAVCCRVCRACVAVLCFVAVVRGGHHRRDGVPAQPSEPVEQQSDGTVPQSARQAGEAFQIHRYGLCRCGNVKEAVAATLLLTPCV